MATKSVNQLIEQGYMITDANTIYAGEPAFLNDKLKMSNFKCQMPNAKCRLTPRLAALGTPLYKEGNFTI